MIAAIVPAHNEEALLGDCLAALRVAAASARLKGEPVMLIVVADDCSDRTPDIARAQADAVLRVAYRNVGAARAAGARIAIAAGARWLSFTDADSRVAPDWFWHQLSLGADAVCGTVQVVDWESHPPQVAAQFAATYVDRDGHRHIHGANLGVSTAAYRRARGFDALSSSEDVALVRALEHSRARIAWSALPRVVTSSRRDYRAPAGFGATLQRCGLQYLRRAGGESR